MYTEEDLRATLGAREHEAPDPGLTLAGLDRLRQYRTRRRRTTGMVTAAAVTLALAAGAITVPHLIASPVTGDPVPAANPAGNPWRYTFTMRDVPGYTFSYGSRGLGAQTA